MANEKQVINEKLMGKLMAINVEDYSAHLTSVRSLVFQRAERAGFLP